MYATLCSTCDEYILRFVIDTQRIVTCDIQILIFINAVYYLLLIHNTTKQLPQYKDDGHRQTHSK